MGGKAKTEKMSVTQKIALEKGFGAWRDKNHPELASPEDSTAYVLTIREAAKTPGLLDKRCSTP